MKKENTPTGLRRLWLEWRGFLFILLVLFSFRSALADWNDVPTGSMKPTILEGDRVFINKLAYDLKFPFTTWHLAEWSHPDRGDVIVFYSPADGKRLVKRVIGVPGDDLFMHRGIVYLNGKALEYQPAEGNPDLDAGQRADHHFLTETIGSVSHQVMVSKGTYQADSFSPVVVPEGHYFVMGDHRDNSQDSRYIGFIPRERVIGEAGAVVFSLNYDNWFLPRMGRFLSGL